MIEKNSTTSCGVSTAVGSSNTTYLASRLSTLMISTRCWTPTGRSSMTASGSTWNPHISEVSRTASRAASTSMIPAVPTGS